MRTIESPGVEINEIDLSLIAQLPVGTTVFAVGYAAQGPVDEPINVTSISELEQIYGLPTNAAERYFYHTCRQILYANGTLLTTRLPYGSAAGDGYVNDYSALVYPVFPYTSNATEYTVTDQGWRGTGSWQEQTLSTDINTIPSGSVSFLVLNSASNMISGVDTSYIELSTGPETNITFTINNGSLSASDPIYGGSFVLSDSATDTYDWWVSCSGPLTAGDDFMITTYEVVTGGSFAPCNLTDAEDYYIGAPYHVTVDNTTLLTWKQGGISWKDGLDYGHTTSQITDLSGVGYAGLILVNEAKTAINDLFAGYYVAIADNSKIDKGSNFDSIRNVKTFNGSTAEDSWLELTTDRLAFALTGTYSTRNSISEIVETTPGWDFSNTGQNGYSDSIILALLKLRPSLYNDDERSLDRVLMETHVGSFDSTRTINNPRGGEAVNFFLENVINNSGGALRAFINPNISTRGNAWFDPITNDPLKKVRVMAPARTPLESSISVSPPEPTDFARQLFNLNNASTYMSDGDNLYGTGIYTPCNAQSEKLIGNLPYKLERSLRLVENREQIRVDIVPESGLGTIWTGMVLDMNNWPADATNRDTFEQDNQLFDDTIYINGILDAHTFDRDSEGLADQETGSAAEAQDLYETINQIFITFCETTRKDCLHVADPLRYIFVQGPGDVKVLTDKSKNFSQHIFWPLKNLFGAANTSYACTYANWFKINDNTSGKFIWAPPSGYISRLMIDTDTRFFPWYAPAGLTRGILRDIVDIGVNPSQKQRDLLYKNGINPTVYWPGDGYVVWGQKTLQTKPSAFDRINVRRLFLWLEKAVLALARYFVFEQNTVFTRTRLKDAIDPIFQFAKANEGVYDYMIVCDERNNTPETIDRNELIVDIYIKPVRVAEFILINFIATRTGQDFTELI